MALSLEDRVALLEKEVAELKEITQPTALHDIIRKEAGKLGYEIFSSIKIGDEPSEDISDVPAL